MIKKYISDEVGFSTLEKLELDKHYLIIAGTGSGKTYFIKNTLKEFVLEKDKKLLILTHRTSLRVQTKNDIQNAKLMFGFYEDDNIQILNYQSILTQDRDFLEQFDYIVCDEAHYFTNDSWNNKTLDEFETIKNLNAIKIYMTATYKTFLELFSSNDKIEMIYKQKGIDDNLSNKKKNIRKIYITSNEDNFLAFIQQRKNKTLSVYSSPLKAYESTLILRDSAFNCSKYNKSFFNSRSEEVIRELETSKKFSVKILNSTTAIEGGVDIVDTELDLIAFNGYFLRDTLEQIAGRKRFLEEEDVLDFLVLEPNLKSKSKRITDITKDLRDIQKTKEKGFEPILKERETRTMLPTWARIEDTEEITIDYTKVEKLKSELDWLYQIQLDGMGIHLANIHGISKYEIIDLDKETLELNLFENFYGKKLFKTYNKEVEEYIGKEEFELQDRFKDLLMFTYGLRGGNGSKNNKSRPLGIKTINSFFEENNISYQVSKKTKQVRIKKRRKIISYWELIEIV